MKVENLHDSTLKATAIVILNYKGVTDTISCIESCLQLIGPVSIIVVDNFSPDDSIPVLQRWGRERLCVLNAERRQNGRPEVRFIEAGPELLAPDALPTPELHEIHLLGLNVNLGYAHGNNCGIRYAWAGPFAYFWVLNNDTEVAPDALAHLQARFDEDSRIGMCGSKLVYYDRPDRVQNLAGGCYSPLKGRSFAIGMGSLSSSPCDRANVERQLSYVSGASMLVSREMIDAVGLMEESYFLFWEEVEWAFRAKGRFKLGFAQNSIVRHRVGASIGTEDIGKQSLLAEFYMLRNRIRFCRKYSRCALPFVAADVARQLGRTVWAGDWNRFRVLCWAVIGWHLYAGRVISPTQFRSIGGEAQPSAAHNAPADANRASRHA
ncbi:glycosyltransferase family 2 protein [Alsobacter soli]|uniref:Glycosyltransferase family 2 protein n=1 Tax=Alsobacter soli TaxID=2109933 RepID=A0A2T1HNB3_9HYPH|nr:glycosyltransferase family 2 protein [Alsobacter soli]PSC03145.1 glycosyltransferase family 2 protein [Alsobacter soli]